MPIDRPRRIFRSALPRLEVKGLVVVLGIGLMTAAGVSLATLPRREATPMPTAAEELHGQASQIAVIDGATLRLRDRVVLLQGVDAPPRGTPCNASAGSEDDCGRASANALAALVRDATVACRITGADGFNRAYAVCRTRGSELNRAVVAAGWARAEKAQPALKQAEAAARAGRLGLWASTPDLDW